MAVGGFPAGIAAVWPSMIIIGCGIFHRELLMDIKDISGDAMTGVPTVPVLLGRDGASRLGRRDVFVTVVTTVRYCRHFRFSSPLSYTMSCSPLSPPPRRVACLARSTPGRRPHRRRGFSQISRGRGGSRADLRHACTLAEGNARGGAAGE